MRSAPAVAVRCSGGPLWHTLHTLLPALAAAALLGWGALLAGSGEPGALALAALAGLGTGLVAFRHGRPRTALLQWDGQRWTADGAPGDLQLMMDPGLLMVLRLHLDAGGERWLPVSATEAGPAWHALRAAVHARAPRPTPAPLRPESMAG